MSSLGERDLMIGRLLSAVTLRERVLAENVANQNVPGYQRREVRFEDALRQRVAAGRSTADLQPTIEIDTDSPAGPNGNNVSLEREAASLKENWIAYQFYASILQSRIATVQTAITESR